MENNNKTNWINLILNYLYKANWLKSFERMREKKEPHFYIAIHFHQNHFAYKIALDILNKLPLLQLGTILSFLLSKNFDSRTFYRFIFIRALKIPILFFFFFRSKFYYAIVKIIAKSSIYHLLCRRKKKIYKFSLNIYCCVGKFCKWMK